MKANQVKIKFANALTDDQLSFLERMLEQGGPDEEDYLRFATMVDSFNEDAINDMRDVLHPLLRNINTTQGYAFSKPFGYAGDFLMIEKIYKKKITTDPMYKKWDIWWQKSHAATAVRNRKSYFINLMSELEKKSIHAKKVLILGSGPATDVNEYLKKNPNSKIRFDLLDLDENAIEYAKGKNHMFSDKLNFFRINVLRFNTHKRYDLIWSAGLFDYFKEKHFIYLLKKYLKLLNEYGELVVGNFSDNNPTLILQEAFSAWYLNYRSEFDLLKIASSSGLNKRDVRIEKEPLGVNLFMRVKLKKEISVQTNRPIPIFKKYSNN